MEKNDILREKREKAINVLTNYNRWRRDDKGNVELLYSATEVGESIDFALSEMKSNLA